MHSADYAVERCPSVCLSVTRRYSIETAQRVIKHTILVFPYQTVWEYSDGDPHNEGIECRVAIFGQYLPFISEIIQDRDPQLL